MTNIQLTQNKLFLKQEFALGDGGISVKRTSPLKKEMYTIRYEELSPVRYEIDQRPARPIKGSVILSLLFLLRYIWLGITGLPTIAGYFATTFLITAIIVGVMVYQLRLKNEIIFRAAPFNLRFLKNKPSYEELENFIAALYRNQKEYIYSYGRRAEASTLEELERLAYLKNMQALTDNEFDELKRRVLEKDRINRQFFGGASIN